MAEMDAFNISVYRFLSLFIMTIPIVLYNRNNLFPKGTVNLLFTFSKSSSVSYSRLQGNHFDKDYNRKHQFVYALLCPEAHGHFWCQHGCGMCPCVYCFHGINLSKRKGHKNGFCQFGSFPDWMFPDCEASIHLWIKWKLHRGPWIYLRSFGCLDWQFVSRFGLHIFENA